MMPYGPADAYYEKGLKEGRAAWAAGKPRPSGGPTTRPYDHQADGRRDGWDTANRKTGRWARLRLWGRLRARLGRSG